MLRRLQECALPFQLYHTPWHEASPEGKVWMAQFGFSDLKTLGGLDYDELMPVYKAMASSTRTQPQVQPQ